MLGSKSQNILNYEKRWGFILFLLQLGGISMKNKPRSLILSGYNYFTIFGFLLTLYGTSMYAVQNIHESQKCMNALRVVGSILAFGWLVVCFRFRICDVERIVEFANQFPLHEFESNFSETNQLSKSGLASKIIKVTKYLLFAILIQHGLNTIITVFYYHDTVFPVEFGVDVPRSLIFQIVNMAHLSATVCGVGLLTGFPCFYAVLICIACNEFEKLRASFTEIKQELILAEGEQQVDINMQNRIKQNKLNDIIQRHQLLMTYLSELQQNLHVTLFGLLFTSGLAMCISAFSILTSETSADITQGILAYILTVSGSGMYCWFGQELSTEVERLKISVFNCDWVGAPTSFQRSLLPVTAISNKGFEIRGGNFIPVNNATLIAMLNHTISVFLFLQEVMKSNEKVIQATST